MSHKTRYKTHLRNKKFGYKLNIKCSEKTVISFFMSNNGDVKNSYPQEIYGEIFGGEICRPLSNNTQKDILIQRHTNHTNPQTYHIETHPPKSHRELK